MVTSTIVSTAFQSVPGGGHYWLTNIGTNRRIKQYIAEDGTSFGINFPTDGLLQALRPNSVGLQFAQTSADGRRFPFGWDAAGNLYMAGQINPVPSTAVAAPYPAPVSPDTVYSPQGFVSALNHSTIIGQSLGTGEDSPAITAVQPFNNLKLSTGVTMATGTSLSSATLIPLVADTGSQGTGPKETISNGCADHVASVVSAADLSHPMLLSGSGIPGTTYAAMAGPTDFGGSGSPSFQQCMAQIAAGKSLAPSTYSHKAILQLHGETDAQNGNANYAANLVTWQADIQDGSHAITGSKAVIPMLMGQCVYSLTGLAQLATGSTVSLSVQRDWPTPTGYADLWYADMSIVSTDGTVTQVLTSSPAFGSGQVFTGDYANAGAVAVVESFPATGIDTLQPTRYYFSDHLGSAQMEFTQGGWPVASSQFAPFGGEINPQTTQNHYKFTGKERDTESGLDYFGARYYASSMGRFMSPDWSAKAEPVPYAKLDNPQSLNLYAYMRNNPLGGVDQDGHFPTSAHTQWTASQLVSLDLDQGNANSFSKTVNFAIDNWEGGPMGLFNGSMHGMAGVEAYSVARATLLSDATTIHDGDYLQAAVALTAGDHLVQDYVAHAGMEGPFAEVQHVERYGFGDANPNSMMGEEAKFQTNKFKDDFLAGLKANYGDAAPGILSKILDAAKSGVVGPAVEQEHRRVEGAIAADQKKRDNQ